MKNLVVGILVGLVFLTPQGSFADSDNDGGNSLPEVAGIVGMTPVVANSCVAIWIPVPDDQALSGIVWYNNDSLVAFPEILLESGVSQYPVSMAECRQVAENVFGDSSAWSEVTFDEPVTCGSLGLYVLFRFPEGSEQEAVGAGGGAGFGFVEDGGHEGWMSTDGNYWVRVDQACGFAVQPVFIEAESGMVHMNGAIPGEGLIKYEESVVYETGMLPVAPNPFNPETEIRFTLKDSDRVTISVFDIRGRRVVDLLDEVFSSGRHSVTWQGQNQTGQRVASGVYFARLKVGEASFVRHMLLLK